MWSVEGPCIFDTGDDAQTQPASQSQKSLESKLKMENVSVLDEYV